MGEGDGVGVGVAVGEGVGVGCGPVQLARTTVAMPEREAARKVRRGMPPGVARESMDSG
jgi:hypothetical protein